MTEPKPIAPVQETQLYDGPDRSSLDVRGGELTVVDGPNRGQRLVLGPLPVRVGTAVGSHLRLTDPTVSRLHFQLTPRREGMRLVDAGSTNGTFIDGLRIHDVELHGGATIRIGATTLRLEAGTEPVRIPLSQHSRFGALIGASVEMRRLYAILERAAPTEATVLIQGETGTGKELVAKEIHAHSPRAAGPFIPVDCSTLSPNLIESELFGHARGAFTDAKLEREGLFAAARGGTIFLDEIGELPLALQSKLLRALENREIRPVGSNAPRPIDVRVVAATNRSLAQGVNAGIFREDLYYRLAVVDVVLPPLRTRREDIPALATQFLHRVAGPSVPVPAELLTIFIARNWPGNVRELKNVIERCWALGQLAPDPATATTAPVEGGSPEGPGSSQRATKLLAVDLERPFKDERDAVMTRFERLYVEGVLERAGGNVTRAAALAGVPRRSLQRLIVRLGIRGASDGGLEGIDDGDPEGVDDGDADDHAYR